MLRNHPKLRDIITQLKHANKIWEKVGSAQFMPASAILELLHDPFTELFYRAFEQYWRKLRQYFLHASYYFFMLLIAAICALIHAILPPYSKKTASQIISKLYRKITETKLLEAYSPSKC